MADIPVDKRAPHEIARRLQARRAEAGAPGQRRSWLSLAAGAVAFLLLGALLISLRAPAARIAPPSSSDDPGSVGDATPGGVFVHVAGAVRKPGLYELGPEARVADAIEAAGGALPKAEVDLVNLAQMLTDGMKIEVPVSGKKAPSVAAPTDPATATALVSINSAGLEELETLPGVGPVTAQAIISHREEAGPFASLEGLLEVSGIGPATFAEIRPHVTL